MALKAYHIEISEDRKRLLELRQRKHELDRKLFPCPYGARHLKEKAKKDRETIYQAEMKELVDIRKELIEIPKKYDETLFRDIFHGDDPRYDGENDPADLLLVAERVLRKFI